MGPVMRGVPAIDTEGLMSLVTRTVKRNHLPSSHILLSQVGAAHANNPTASLIPDLDEVRLASILRQPIAEIRRRRHLPLADAGYVDFFGCAVRSDEIVFRRRRFAPAAVARSAHARALWSLKMVPCCTETWEHLVDVCACGEVQRWQSADRIDRCDHCNAALADAPAIPVHDDHRDGLAFIIGLLDPDDERRHDARAQLPPALTSMDGGMVFDLALAVMPLTIAGFTPARKAEPAVDDLPVYTASLAQAADIVRRWPESPVEALSDAVRRRSVSRENVRYKGTGHYLAGLESELLPITVRKAIADALAPITSTAGDVPADQIGMRDAALFTGQEEHKLASARRHGHLQMRICLRYNRLLPTLDRAEIDLLEDILKNRIGPETFTHRLHLPQYAMAQMQAEKVITCIAHPYIVAQFGPLQAHASELAAFRAALEEAASPADAIVDPVPLHRVARAIGGSAKPWGAIIRQMLDGDLPYSIDGGSMNRVMIPSTEATRLRTRCLQTTVPAIRSRYVSQRDAAEILNLPLKHAHVIPVRHRQGGGAHQIEWSRLRRIARDRVTLAELCARSGIHGTRLEAMLKKDGCHRHDALGWMRRKALAKIANY